MNEAKKYNPTVAAMAMKMMPELLLEKKVLKNASVPLLTSIFCDGGFTKALTTRKTDRTTR